MIPIVNMSDVQLVDASESYNEEYPTRNVEILAYNYNKLLLAAKNQGFKIVADGNKYEESQSLWGSYDNWSSFQVLAKQYAVQWDELLTNLYGESRGEGEELVPIIVGGVLDTLVASLPPGVNAIVSIFYPVIRMVASNLLSSLMQGIFGGGGTDFSDLISKLEEMRTTQESRSESWQTEQNERIESVTTEIRNSFTDAGSNIPYLLWLSTFLGTNPDTQINPHVDKLVEAILSLLMQEGRFVFGSYEISVGHGGVVGIRRFKEGTK